MALSKALISIAALGTIVAKEHPLDIPTTINGIVLDPHSTTAHRDLLTVVASLKFRECAGWKPPICADALPKPCISETRPLCSQQVADHLFQLLDVRDEVLLQEWTTAFIANDLCITPEAIPSLLEIVCQRPDFRDVVRSIGSERMMWLAEQRDDSGWYWLNPLKSNWDNCTPEERIAYIDCLRKVDPSRARQMVKSVWDQSSEWMRRQYIAAFETGLSMDDEAWLEHIRQTGTRTVSFRATILLGRLPESTFCRRIIDYAKTLIVVTKRRGKLQFKLVDEGNLDSSILNDLIADPSFSDLDKVGNILEYVPPQYWLEYWNVTAAELLRSVDESRNLRMVLMDALTLAAYRFRDREFAGNLLPYLWKYRRPPYHLIYSIIPPQNFELEAIRLLNDADGPFSYQHPAELPMTLVEGIWSEELTGAFLDVLEKKHIEADSQTIGLLTKHSRHIALNDADRLCKILTSVGTTVDFIGTRSTTRRWEQMVETVTRLLDLRLEMLAAIRNDEGL